MQKANEYCIQNEWGKCSECYDLALNNTLDANSTIKSKYLSYQSLALIKLGKFDEALAKATDALAFDPQNEFAKNQISESENQMQSTKFSYDCEEGLTFSFLIG